MGAKRISDRCSKKSNTKHFADHKKVVIDLSAA